MQPCALSQRFVVDALGTEMPVATVVGSGIMAEHLMKTVALAFLDRLPLGLFHKDGGSLMINAEGRQVG